RLIRLTWSAERRMSSLPTSVEPVKLIFRTAGLRKKTSAMARDGPITRLATPRGTPASARQENIAINVSGVWSAGRLTTVHPAARAGAILRLGSAAGKFQGVIVATTPTGCLIAWCRFATLAGGMIRP